MRGKEERGGRRKGGESRKRKRKEGRKGLGVKEGGDD